VRAGDSLHLVPLLRCYPLLFATIFFLPLLSRILEQDFRFDSKRMITELLFLDNSGGSWQ